MPGEASVEAARKRVSRVYNKWLNDKFSRKISELGRDTKRSRLPQINANTGTWRDGNKPPAWLIHFNYADEGWTATAPTTRFSGSLNMQAQTDFQGVYFRLIPMVVIDGNWKTHPYWEWTMAFIFPGLPTAWRGGSTGTVLDFDPQSGALTALIGGANRRQDYVDAGLFSLIENRDEQWDERVDLTYGNATNILAQYIIVDCAVPQPEVRD